MRLAPALLLALAAPAAADTLVVGNKGEDTVSLVDLVSGREVARLPTGPQPHEVAISPDGARAAVVAYGGNGIDLFDIARGERIGRVDLGANRRPHGLLWLADGRLLATAEGSGTLALVDMAGAAPQVRAFATGAAGSHMVARHRDTAYVANMESGSVSVVDLAGDRPTRQVATAPQPEGIAVSPDGDRLWVASRDANSVTVYDTATLEPVATVPVGRIPIRIAISPNGARAAVSNYGDGSVTLIDTASLTPVRTYALGGAAAQQVTILYSPDGERLFVAETGPDRVAELDVASGNVLRRIAVGRDGDGLGLSRVDVRQ